MDRRDLSHVLGGAARLLSCRRYRPTGGLSLARGHGCAPQPEGALCTRRDLETLPRHRRPIAMGLLHAGPRPRDRKRRCSEPIAARPSNLSKGGMKSEKGWDELIK